MADPPLWRAVARMSEPPGRIGGGEALRRALFSAALPEAEAQRHLARMGGESRAALLEAQAPQPVAPAWGVGKPAVVLGARRDPLVPADALARTAAWHAAPYALLDGTGHAMMLDAAWEEVADRLLGWLAETLR
jgi:hypothetical protein